MGPLRVPDPDNPGGFLPRHPGEHAARKHRYRTAWVESLPYLPAPTPLHPLDDDEILALVHGLTRLDSEGARRLERALLVANEVQLPLGGGRRLSRWRVLRDALTLEISTHHLRTASCGDGWQSAFPADLYAVRIKRLETS
jgi:hypothetical protein